MCPSVFYSRRQLSHLPFLKPMVESAQSKMALFCLYPPDQKLLITHRNVCSQVYRNITTGRHTVSAPPSPQLVLALSLQVLVLCLFRRRQGPVHLARLLAIRKVQLMPEIKRWRERPTITGIRKIVWFQMQIKLHYLLWKACVFLYVGPQGTARTYLTVQTHSTRCCTKPVPASMVRSCPGPSSFPASTLQKSKCPRVTSEQLGFIQITV